MHSSLSSEQLSVPYISPRGQYYSLPWKELSALGSEHRPLLILQFDLTSVSLISCEATAGYLPCILLGTQSCKLSGCRAVLTWIGVLHTEGLAESGTECYHNAWIPRRRNSNGYRGGIVGWILLSPVSALGKFQWDVCRKRSFCRERERSLFVEQMSGHS